MVRDEGVLYLERAPRWEIIERAADEASDAQILRTIYSLVWTPFTEESMHALRTVT